MTIPTDAIRAFCTRWMIVEFAIFGSAIRDDFGPDSDVDVLVTFAPGTTRDFDDYDQMEDELAALFGRRVDLVERRRVVNPFRLAHILANHRVVYAA
jgi:predicted nucleotidyltransferase